MCQMPESTPGKILYIYIGVLIGGYTNIISFMFVCITIKVIKKFQSMISHPITGPLTLISQLKIR